MPDDITLTTGQAVATDEVAGRHYQINKQAYGDLDAATLVSPANPLPVKEARSATSVHTSVAASITVVTLLAANPLRIAASVYNDSTSVLYLKLGSAASATSLTLPMAANTYYEVPADWAGIITGIWATATGNARVGERTL